MQLRDRVKELVRVPAGELVPSPQNWHTHSAKQRRALRGVLKEIGLAGACLVFRNESGAFELIDGHARTGEVDPNQELPCLVLDVTREEAYKVLATFDTVGGMAGTDALQLRELLAEITLDDDDLRELTTEIAGLDEPTGPKPSPKIDARAYGGATAAGRGSAPMRFWKERGYLKGKGKKILDFGCGHDDHGHAKYDAFTHPDTEPLRKKWDVVLCNYVLSVQPVEHLVTQLLCILWNLTVERDGSRVLVAVHADEKAAGSTRGFHRNVDQWEELFSSFFEVDHATSEGFLGFVLTPKRGASGRPRNGSRSPSSHRRVQPRHSPES